MSPRTLERWRWLKQGPRYIKLGGHVAYRLEDLRRLKRCRRGGNGMVPFASTPPFIDRIEQIQIAAMIVGKRLDPYPEASSRNWRTA